MKIFLLVFVPFLFSGCFSSNYEQLTLTDKKGLNSLNKLEKLNYLTIKNSFDEYKLKYSKDECEAGICQSVSIIDDEEIIAVFEGTQTAFYKILIKTADIKSDIIGSVEDDFTDDLSSFITKNSYTTYCKPGQEEYSGKVLCKSQYKNNQKMTQNTVHVLSGKYDGVDGVLPPYEVIKNFRIEATVWSSYLQ